MGYKSAGLRSRGDRGGRFVPRRADVGLRSRQSRPGEQQSARGRYTQFRLVAVGVVGLNLALLGMAALQTKAPLPNSAEFLAWVVFVAIAGFVPLSSGRGPSLAMDLPLLLAAAFIFGPMLSGLIALLGAVDIRELRREISWPRAIWNRSQTSRSVMCASVVFSELSHLGDWPLTPLVALVALGVDVAVNYTIVAYGTSLRRGASFRESLRAMRFGSPSSFLMSYLCFGFIGILIAEAYT
ncbi:MAG: hypothetical protein K0R20_1547, partial [Actinomycetia bacterium]|nr:hypothetical protein [Actinomycetes bacterium]